ncbi:MAG: ABC transporter ATP-binding protein [Proteobacteria bacterium]|jgi:ABC-type multidrug transport system fused ATPase/permease subunit|nr:ABC transporter ATP-binding protein [Pseudomonadota bacterium]MDA1300423.1 ABC transporter ATP-binding protein [Pseudomonadota bacterium]
MGDLALIAGYMAGDDTVPPPMSLRRMFQLTLKTWPYMRPMLVHLLVLLGFGASGGLIAIVTAFVGTDLWTNKVLVGEKLQPIQATVLFVGDEYVTTDPEKLGNGKQAAAPMKNSAAAGKGGPAVSVAEMASAGGSAAEPALTQAQRKMVRNRLIIWGIIGAVLTSVVGLIAWYYTTWIWHCINQNLRVAMAEQAESLSLRYHDNNRVGDVMFRVYQDSAQIVNLLQSGIISPAITIYYLIIGLFIVAAFDPLFAAMLVAVGVPIGWLAVVTTPRIRRRSLANRNANSALTSRAQEVFSAIKIVKANHAEDRVFERFDADSRRALDTAYFLRLDMVLITLVVAMLGGALVLTTEYIMVTWVIEQRETFLGALVASVIGFVMWNYGAFSIARGRIGGSMVSARGLMGIWMRMQDLFVALERAFFLLDLQPEVSDPDEPVAFPAPISQVAWEQVSFGYVAHKPLLRTVNLDASAGTMTAIVGTTGAGKSTLMSLLLRLYDPDEGRITINGVDLRDMAVDDIRANTAIALQKNVLFADSVANNIKFGTQDADRESIEKAAQIACADEFITQMARGYDTELGERGGKLSAGQRQRLSIARAVVRNTPILILDEPTASLDARTEQQVLANLAEWGKGKVIFLITHRLSTIRNADQIAFLENGQIAELGAHDELMAREAGRYHAFVMAETLGAASGVSL